MVLAEIHLPKQAPERLKDRETLWNEVEWIEGKMIADLAIHDPKKAKDKIPNPHMHIMVPIRPLQEDGTWG